MKRIVLLEDEVHSRHSMAALLRGEGHEVLLARNALEAQAQCMLNIPDVAIVDIHLPGLRGDEWAMYLKGMFPDTRIIFVSGQAGLAGVAAGEAVMIEHRLGDADAAIAVEPGRQPHDL